MTDETTTAPAPVPTMDLKKWAEGRTGGTYIPPFRMRQLQQQVEDKSSIEYQRLTWEALKKSINGLLNKVCLTPNFFCHSKFDRSTEPTSRTSYPKFLVKISSEAVGFLPVHA